jgi:hypothetical protein
LGTADNDCTLNKEATSYNDIFDAFRLALKFYRYEDSSRDLVNGSHRFPLSIDCLCALYFAILHLHVFPHCGLALPYDRSEYIPKAPDINKLQALYEKVNIS